MKVKKLTPTNFKYKRTLLWVGAVTFSLMALVTIFLLQSKTEIVTNSNTDLTEKPPALPPFPIGVDPVAKVITEDPAVTSYMESYVASNHTSPRLSDSWFSRAVSKLAMQNWYQNLATPATRILIIQSGERKEEVIKNFSQILNWDKTEIEAFSLLLEAEVPPLPDGKLYPGRYIVASDASPETVAFAIADRFNAEVRARYPDTVEETLPLSEALVVASLIEREAYDFEDMRYISGVIWNRLFIDMRLQIDATLQYAKATAALGNSNRGWWPVPKPEDKFIDSPYNTYQNAGLPPAPIANPSVDAIIAALNPRQTDCLFYYHTDDGTFYCNATYEEHVEGLRQHFGQGK